MSAWHDTSEIIGGYFRDAARNWRSTLYGMFATAAQAWPLYEGYHATGNTGVLLTGLAGMAYTLHKGASSEDGNTAKNPAAP